MLALGSKPQINVSVEKESPCKKRYLLTKHNYTSIFTCNQKVFQYISNEIPCHTVQINGKYCVCFGTYRTRKEAKDSKDFLLEMGLKTTIKESEV